MHLQVEPPTTAPELPLRQERAYERAYDAALKAESARLHQDAIHVLCAGKGELRGRFSEGHPFAYGPEQIWDAVINTMTDEDRWLMLAVAATINPATRRALDAFIQTHADEYAAWKAAHRETHL